MKTETFLSRVLTIVLFLVAASCDRGPQFVKGQYIYENQELTCLNDLIIEWDSDNLSDDIKDVVREIVASMTFVKGGSFTMGSNDIYSFSDEQPTHTVSLSDYYIAKVTITQKQWTTIMGKENPLWSDSYGKGDNFPANFISFEQAKQFVSRLNTYSGLQFRLPTEAEWEYAACGGKQYNDYIYIYSGSDIVSTVAWYRDNANGIMHPVATLAHNDLGLYDMSGNVWEWCSDWYGSYATNSVTDPVGPTSGTKRVVRGGSFSYEARYSRCKTRNCLPETNQSFAVGLRLALSK